MPLSNRDYYRDRYRRVRRDLAKLTRTSKSPSINRQKGSGGAPSGCLLTILVIFVFPFEGFIIAQNAKIQNMVLQGTTGIALF